MDYEKDTRLAYRNESKAKDYKEQYTKGMKWARITMWRQRVFIGKALRQCNLTKADKILDIPCGTGFLGKVLSKFPASIIASDISREMMDLARGEYVGKSFYGFIQSDITKTPFKKETFACVVLLALMHRLPVEIRKNTLVEITTLSCKFIIVSYSVDSNPQRLKQWLIKKIRPAYKPAPSSLSFLDIINELNSHGLIVRRVFNVIYFLSAKVIFLLEKKV